MANSNTTNTISNTHKNIADFGFPPPPLSPEEQQSSHFYPFESTDFPPIFPIYPVIEQQSSISMNFLDGFFPDMSMSPEPAVREIGSLSKPSGLAKSCLLMREWSSSITKAARSKKRIARRDLYNFRFGPDIKEKLRFLLQKKLRKTDVSSLGRIVLPKRDAEANLPLLPVKEGIQIPVSDTTSSNVWIMQYRFWLNKKSRMYVLENTGDFVEQYGLKTGDHVILYQDEDNHIFISAKKSKKLPPTDSREIKEEDEGDHKITTDDSISTQSVLAAVDSSSSKDLLMEKVVTCLDPPMDDFRVYDYGQLDLFPSFEDCDLSLYDDDLMEGSEEKEVEVK
ncbi:uncharacterized protein LOC143853715 [Tasmannia lanceolata]|uniref:uncharacterized protein LOC143853715 n=1 Tax=Tasmannia lanceolata TaxID=3420 RepID=UPI004064B623